MRQPVHGRRRDTNRAEGYDYSLPGWYYVTVCTHELSHLFGEVREGEMHLNDFGKIVTEEWHRTALVRPDVTLDAFILMPNHLHGIIVIEADEHLVRARRCLALDPAGVGSLITERHMNSADASVPDARARHHLARTNETRSSLGQVVGQIKANSTRRINALRQTPSQKIWHRNYYDHIIRDERDLDRVRGYIAGNPGNWAFDKANRKDSIPA